MNPEIQRMQSDLEEVRAKTEEKDARFEMMERELRAIRIQQDRTAERMEEKLRGLWWKLGTVAGIMTLVVGKVFGNGMGSVLAGVLGL